VLTKTSVVLLRFDQVVDLIERVGARVCPAQGQPFFCIEHLDDRRRCTPGGHDIGGFALAANLRHQETVASDSGSATVADQPDRPASVAPAATTAPSPSDNRSPRLEVTSACKLVEHNALERREQKMAHRRTTTGSASCSGVVSRMSRRIAPAAAAAATPAVVAGGGSRP